MTSRYRIAVDRDTCVGTGMCTAIAANFFQMDEQYRSQPLQDTVDADDTVIEAAECCPMEAITVLDDATKEQLAPPPD